jgi:hypothetical protein
VQAAFCSIRHPQPLLSLENAFNDEDIAAFIARLERAGVEKPLFTVEPKMDGLTLSVTYQKGRFFAAATRGDGITGENVTANAAVMNAIPKKLNKDIPLLVLRGEVYMPKRNFAELNEKKGATIMIVTHDAFTASFCKRIIFIKDGLLFNELNRGDMPRKVFYQNILQVLAVMGGGNGDAC